MWKEMFFSGRSGDCKREHRRIWSGCGSGSTRHIWLARAICQNAAEIRHCNHESAIRNQKLWCWCPIFRGGIESAPSQHPSLFDPLLTDGNSSSVFTSQNVNERGKTLIFDSAYIRIFCSFYCERDLKLDWRRPCLQNCSLTSRQCTNFTSPSPKMYKSISFDLYLVLPSEMKLL